VSVVARSLARSWGGFIRHRPFVSPNEGSSTDSPMQRPVRTQRIFVTTERGADQACGWAGLRPRATTEQKPAHARQFRAVEQRHRISGVAREAAEFVGRDSRAALRATSIDGSIAHAFTSTKRLRR